jgi:hypothetical protein
MKTIIKINLTKHINVINIVKVSRGLFVLNVNICYFVLIYRT